MSTITQFPSGNTYYRIEFDYLARTFIVVTLVNSSNPTLNRVLEVGRDYRFLNPTMIEMLVDQSGFDIVRIHRQTGTDLVVDFRNGSVLTASDLTNAELQAIHIAEEGRDQTVDLAKEYADAAASSAGNAKDSEDEARRIAETIKAAGRLGYITRRSFEKGFNVTTWNEVLLWEEDGAYYRWDGTLPKNVPAGSTPETSGGIGLGAWVSVGDASLRSDLSSDADGGGDALVTVKQPIENSIKRTQHYKNAEVISIQDFGGNPDGITNNDEAITNASSFPYLLVPNGLYISNLDPKYFGGPYYGPGSLIGSDGKKRGSIFTSITSAPKSFGSEESVVTAFSGDMSKCPFPIEHRIYGEDTLGKPASGYTYRHETFPNYTYLYNSSGWNESTTSNEGRTGVAAYRAKVDNYGQGDAICFNGSAFVTGTKPGSTNFLANPASVLFNGDMTAGSDGVYLNPHEIILHDNGCDVAAVGFVGNFDRTVGTGAKSAIWHGIRLQSIGTMQCDAMFSASGKWRSGIDLAQSTTDLGANQAAISLKSGQRIYLNNNANDSGNTEAGWHTTGFNGDFISYEYGHIVVAAGGNPSLEMSSTRVTFNAQIGIKSAGNVSSSATSGTNALPSNPAGFISIYIDGKEYKMPFYNA